MESQPLSTIDAALEALRKGQFIVVMDDESRENEGDLIIAAQFITPKQTAFMVKHTNGILCTPMTKERADVLNLPPMVTENKDRNTTNFTVSCDAIRGTSTGASASDRCITARTLADPNTTAADISRPGHVFPLIAREGGVLTRRGHTEATVDFLQLAGLHPVGVICELMHEDGHMLRFQECCDFARQHSLHIVSVEQLVQYRETHTSFPITNPTANGNSSSSNVLDEVWMQRALQLAEQGRMSAPPNPWVGCVIVKNDSVVGEGWHHRAGDLHAEAQALLDVTRRCGSEEAAKAVVQGSTVYVTLEPCAHTGRQPPCDAALIRAQVSRVVVGVTDPDSRVASQGIQNLRNAGIQVEEGVLRAEIEESLLPYLHHRRTARPWCILKTAASIDGKIACGDGSSQWITSPKSRINSHLLRARSQAVVVGSGTALADNPSLTIRVSRDQVSHREFDQVSAPRGGDLLRVLLDGRGRVTGGHMFEVVTGYHTVVFTTASAAPNAVAAWHAAKADVVTVDPDSNGTGVNVMFWHTVCFASNLDCS
eukprot:c9214_g1_i2.p1 GENE.c9214_g1_i2~~c9214_g1_i2.p1  ORF type:complete len:540 (-),score=120.81 c9214_g1_i2:85-1704(-)